MNANYLTLRNLIFTLRQFSFWNRIFHWRRVREQLVDAAAALSAAEAEFNQALLSAQSTAAHLEKQSAADHQRIDHLASRKAELELELAAVKQELKHVRQDWELRTQEQQRLLQEEEFRKQEHASSLSTLKEWRDQLARERAMELEQRQEDALNKLRLQKATWNDHEEAVRQAIRAIALKHGIQRVEQVPFAGTPDNTLLICEEFMVFDAKSPAGESLVNFPAYLKDQSEKAVKYARAENVNKDIFFVVPSNTLAVMRQYIYRLGSYNVFVISLESLEPVILAYQKLEAYEFAREMSPEDRENICRVIGKFAHLSKRRIQVDHFFIRQFMELVRKTAEDLPADILSEVLEFEKAEKLNPPVERRAKEISLAALEKETVRLGEDATRQGIATVENNISVGLNALPLYTNE